MFCNNFFFKKIKIQLSKDQQYNRQNCIEFSVTPESLSDDNLENTTIEIFSNIDVNINERDIESCHRLLVRRSSAIVGKWIMKNLLTTSYMQHNIKLYGYLF